MDPETAINRRHHGVATVFRATGDRVSAALRFPDLRAALDFAHLYAELAATDQP